MRIVWKDSNAKDFKPKEYRGYIVTGYNGGWITNIDVDNNIYKTRDCALNAIDVHLGGSSHKGRAKRRENGIHVIGTKDKISS